MCLELCVAAQPPILQLFNQLSYSLYTGVLEVLSFRRRPPEEL